jgi:hypothetical protein
MSAFGGKASFLVFTWNFGQSPANPLKNLQVGRRKTDGKTVSTLATMAGDRAARLGRWPASRLETDF